MLAKLVYRLGVRLANRLGMYETRDLSYAGKALIYARMFKCSSPIFDVECGRGTITNFMARLSKGIVIGIDIDVNALRSAKRDAGVDFIVADANMLPFRGGSMALVCLFSLLEHVAKPEAVVREVGRVLRRKGIAVVQLPNLQWLIEPHTKWPLLGIMPHFIREAVRKSIRYGYINFSATIKKLVRAFESTGLTLVAKESLWHSMKIRLGYPPAYLLVFRKK